MMYWMVVVEPSEEVSLLLGNMLYCKAKTILKKASEILSQTNHPDLKE